MDREGDVDRGFRRLHEARVKNYEEDLERYRRDAAQAESAQRADEGTIQSLRDAGVEVEPLRKLERQSEEALERFLARVRPSLVERPPLQAQDARRRALRFSAQSANRIVVPTHAATLLAVDRVDLDDMKGEGDGLWVLPFDPSELKLKRASTGSGWGCVAAVAGPPPPTAVIWFMFVPDQTGSWWLNVYAEAHGFYVLRADDRWYNCKHATASVGVSVDVNQYDYWHGEQQTRLLDRDDDNISLYELLDLPIGLAYSTSLRAGDPVYVALTLTIDAFALGSGSFAEVNFADGTGNYVKPYGLLAQFQG
jgi:hypothetical protein